MGSIREAPYAGMNAAAEAARTRGYRDRIILALMPQPGKIVREYAAAALKFPQHAGTIRNQAPPPRHGALNRGGRSQAGCLNSC